MRRKEELKMGVKATMNLMKRKEKDTRGKKVMARRQDSTKTRIGDNQFHDNQFHDTCDDEGKEGCILLSSGISFGIQVVDFM